jgi:hypothetical protein
MRSGQSGVLVGLVSCHGRASIEIFTHLDAIFLQHGPMVPDETGVSSIIPRLNGRQK